MGFGPSGRQMVGCAVALGAAVAVIGLAIGVAGAWLLQHLSVAWR